VDDEIEDSRTRFAEVLLTFFPEQHVMDGLDIQATNFKDCGEIRLILLITVPTISKMPSHEHGMVVDNTC
jgi:hypothetical protein